MDRYEKLLDRILRGKSDANIPFDDLCQLLHYLGFDERTRGSHHIFRKAGIEERINLQRDGSKAKPYQVSQVRRVILRYKLGEVS
jgi:predicted RNA binding protein YcfA (HicA-like mRNA interferase family)